MKDQKALIAQFEKKVLKYPSKCGREYVKSIHNCLLAHKLYLHSVSDYRFGNGAEGIKTTIALILYKNGKYCIVFCHMYLACQSLDSTIPMFYIPRCEHTLEYNTSFLNEDEKVVLPLLSKWNVDSSLQKVLYQILDYLQFHNDYKREPLSSPRRFSIEDVQSKLPIIPYSDIILQSKVGSGKYTVVFGGTFKDKEVAVKIYKKPLSPSSCDSFEREIVIQALLDHPNCLKLYGISYTQDKRPVLVTELASISLQKYILKDHTPISLWEKRTLILEIAEGLMYIHSRGFVHKDIKLENILIKDGHPLIADFGLADDSQGFKVTSGTPAFIAPELIQEGIAKSPADVYSFGCVVNEIFSEKESYADFNFTTLDNFYQLLLDGMRPTISESVPLVVKALIMDCFNSKSYRPPMSSIVQRIKLWTIEDLRLIS